MRAPAVTATWDEANQRYLVAAIAAVRRCLAPDPAGIELVAPPDPADIPFALDTLCDVFSLSEFERAIVLLCAGVELETGFVELISAAQRGSPRPTFSLALAVLPGAHWSALLPGRPLRRWRLIEVEPGSTLVTSALRLDEMVLHYLAGLPELSAELAGTIRPMSAVHFPQAPSHREIVTLVANAWRQRRERPVIQLCGADASARREIAAAAGAVADLTMYELPAESLTSASFELDLLRRLWERHARLNRAGLLVDIADSAEPTVGGVLDRFLDSIEGPVLVGARERRHLRRRSSLVLEVSNPTRAEQARLWRDALQASNEDVDGAIARLTSRFDLGPAAIRAASEQAGISSNGVVESLATRAWSACRTQARPQLDGLAVRIQPAAKWDDLVLPDAQRENLRVLKNQVLVWSTVYEHWGFADQSHRGLGLSALFAGPSGTGKTMAAEVLARDLDLDLYLVDLSQVVSKWIGDTEKNLARVFAAGEQGGAILLFDEADALFGKRSEVKDSHDRYANIEVGYLLQRMESYRGLAILTTNMKYALDAAFLRRLRFIVQFPFPDAALRQEIWRRIFPAATPTEGLDVAKLARLNVTGGHIRNIALNAAFLAAAAQEPVRMRHVLEAARTEYAKLERPLTDAEIRGWS